MLKKFLKSLFLIVIFCFMSGFSDIKQQDDYTCAPVCAANCIVNYNSFKNSDNELIQYFGKTAKTTKKGTKTNNLCKALAKYFKQNKRSAIIKYDGIRPVDKIFKSEKPLDIIEELQNGKSVILNIGIYEFDGKTYHRKYGHYVNAIDINPKGQILLTDPYEKGSAFYVDIEPPESLNIRHNKDDNERILKNKFNIKSLKGIPYLKDNETAFLNGIISINLIAY